MPKPAGVSLQEAFPRECWRRKRLKPGDALFRRGQEASAIFVVVKGAIRLEHGLAGGERVQRSVCGTGAVIGETSFFEGTFGCDGIADGDTEVDALRRRDLLAHVRDHPEAGLALARCLSSEVLALRERLALLQVRSAKERVLGWLAARVPEDRNAHLVIDRPWMDVAVDLGLSHEALYRALAALARERRISRKGRAIALRPHAG